MRLDDDGKLEVPSYTRKENKNNKPRYVDIIQALEKLEYVILEISNRDYLDILK